MGGKLCNSAARMPKLPASAVFLWVLPLLVPAVADELGLRYGRVFLLLLPGLVLAALMAERWGESGLGRWLAQVRWRRVLGYILSGLALIVLLLALGVAGFGVTKGGFGVLAKAIPVALGGLGKMASGWVDAIKLSWFANGAPVILVVLLAGALLARLGRREAPAKPISREAAVVAVLVGLAVQLSHWLVAAIPVLAYLAFAWVRAKPAEAAPMSAPPRLGNLLLATAGFAAAWLLPTLIDQKASSLFPMPLGIGVLTAIAYLLAHLVGGPLGTRLDTRLGGAAVLVGLAMLWWLGPSLAFLGAVLVAAGALALVSAAGSVSWFAPALAALVIGAPQYWRSKVWHEYTPGWTVLAVAAITLLAVTVVLLRQRQPR